MNLQGVNNHGHTDAVAALRLNGARADVDASEPPVGLPGLRATCRNRVTPHA